MRKWIVLLLVAAPVFATEPNPSPKQREIIEKILVATNANLNGKAVLDAMFAEYDKRMQGSDEEDSREIFKIFRERVAKLDLAADIHDAQIRLFSKYFTEKELNDMLSFYLSATGKKMIETMPALMRESIQVGAEQIGPRLEQEMSAARQDYEKSRPWHKTMSDLRTIATALEAYSTDNEDKYPEGDIDAVEKALVPTYIKNFPHADMWGHAYGYVVSPDRLHYRVASAGADSVFAWDTLRIAPVEKDQQVKYSDRLEDDLIYGDATFLQLPVQAKPKSED